MDKEKKIKKNERELETLTEREGQVKVETGGHRDRQTQLSNYKVRDRGTGVIKRGKTLI